MIGTVVRELSDGEELVIEGLPPRSVVDPREGTIEARTLGGRDDGLPEPSES